MVGFSGLTMLVWDHIITFDDEVRGLGNSIHLPSLMLAMRPQLELIWKRDKGLGE